MTGLLNLFQFTQLEVFSEPHEQKYGQFNYCYLIEMHLDKSLFVSCSRMGPTIGSSNCNWVLKLILSCLVLSQNHAFLGYQNLMSCCFGTLKLLPFWSARNTCQCSTVGWFLKSKPFIFTDHPTTIPFKKLFANSFLGCYN